LLGDVKSAFGGLDRIGSADLVDVLVAMDDRPYATWGKSRKPMTQHQLAHQLKDFKVYAKSMRLDDGRTLRGYLREWFEPIWGRYLPHSDLQVVTSLQPSSLQGETQFSGRNKQSDVTSQDYEKAASTLPCNDVTTQKPERVGSGKKSWAEGLACPGCKGIWTSAGSLAQHLPACKLFDIAAMTLTESRLRRGQTAAPELQARYEAYIRLGMGPLHQADGQA
jgi:hypothetical protein